MKLAYIYIQSYKGLENIEISINGSHEFYYGKAFQLTTK